MPFHIGDKIIWHYTLDGHSELTQDIEGTIQEIHEVLAKIQVETMMSGKLEQYIYFVPIKDIKKRRGTEMNIKLPTNYEFDILEWLD